MRRVNHPLYITRDVAKKTQTSKISIDLDKAFAAEHPELIPLFVILSRTLLCNVAPHVSKTFGVYGGEMLTTKHGAIVSHEFYATQHPKRIDFTSADLQKVARECINFVFESNFTRRVSKDLASISYQQRPGMAPDYDKAITETGVLIGSKGWKHLATQKNIDLLLTNTSIQTSSRRITVTERLR